MIRDVERVLPTDVVSQWYQFKKKAKNQNDFNRIMTWRRSYPCRVLSVVAVLEKSQRGGGENFIQIHFIPSIYQVQQRRFNGEVNFI